MLACSIGDRCNVCRDGELRPVLIRRLHSQIVEPGSAGWKTTYLVSHLACETCGIMFQSSESRSIGVIIEEQARLFDSPELRPRCCPRCIRSELKTYRFFPDQSPASTEPVPVSSNTQNVPFIRTYVFCTECFRVLWVSPSQEQVTRRFTLPPPG
jgi:hypothetical protein